MKSLTSIVALNEARAIGAGNALPWKVRSDLAFFRRQTTGHVVIMGRRTFDSLGHGLPDRKNIVVTHGFDLTGLDDLCRPAHSIEEALITSEKMAHAATARVRYRRSEYVSAVRPIRRYLFNYRD